MLLAPLVAVSVALVGMLASMLPAPFLAGDPAALVAVTIPLVLAFCAATFGMRLLAGLWLRLQHPARTGPDDHPDLLPRWLEIDPPHRPEQPRAPGRR